MRSLEKLDPDFRTLVERFLSKLLEESIPVLVTETLRTPDRQRRLVDQGSSWTLNSRHLTGHAIDLYPYLHFAMEKDSLKTYSSVNFDAEHPVWQKIGEIGESFGLTWGGRWKTRDMGHFEIKPK